MQKKFIGFRTSHLLDKKLTEKAEELEVSKSTIIKASLIKYLHTDNHKNQVIKRLDNITDILNSLRKGE